MGNTCCRCGFAADAPMDAAKAAEIGPVCVECLVAACPDLVPGVKTKAAWHPSRTQAEISHVTRMMAYCAAFPEKLREFLEVKPSLEAESSSPSKADEVSFDSMLEPSDEDIEKGIQERILKRTKSDIDGSVEVAKRIFNTDSILEIFDLLTRRPSLVPDAEVGLRVIPITFSQKRMEGWSMNQMFMDIRKEAMELS